jgi:alpha-tubulin suppressor-like RCC1 family protein
MEGGEGGGREDGGEGGKGGEGGEGGEGGKGEEGGEGDGRGVEGREGRGRGENYEVWVCGINEDGELGNGTYGAHATRKKPMPLHVEGGARRIRTGGAHTMLETKNGKFLVWGWNEYQNLGFEDTKRRKRPTPLVLPFSEFQNPERLPQPSLIPPSEQPPVPPSSFPVVDFVCSWYNSLILLEDGSLLIWGDNDQGQLGLGKISECMSIQKLVVRKEGGKGGQEGGKVGEGKGEGKGEGEGEPVKIVAIGCGYFSMWALSEDGDLFTWGCGSSCGHGEKSNFTKPTHVKNIKFKVPFSKRTEWESVFFWLFLGKLDENSYFFVFPVEIIYNFVHVKWANVRQINQ